MTATWKKRFREPQIVFAKLAQANPDRGLVLTDQCSDAYDLCAWTVSSGEMRPLTGDPDGHNAGWISPDGAHVYFLKDEKGNELGHLVRIPFDGREIEDLTPDMKPYTLRGFGFSMDGSSVAFTAVNGDGFQLCWVALTPGGQAGPVRLVHKREKETWGGPLSYDGKLVAVISTVRAGGIRHYSTLAIATESGDVVGELWDGPDATVEAVTFSPLAGDTRLLAMTSRTGFRRPVIWDSATDLRQDLPLEELEGEVVPLTWSPDGKQILVCEIRKGQEQLYFVDLPTQGISAVKHPRGTFFKPGLGVPGTYTVPLVDRDGNVRCLWQNAATPPRFEVFSAQEDQPPRCLLENPSKVSARPWQSVLFKSSDGQDIQGWLGLPEGEPPFPAIVYVHGGPHMIAHDEYDPKGQSWTDEGYAFLSINYRASAMFGQAFKNKIWGDVGHWEMEDIVAGRSWLVEEGLARPEAIFLHGFSYGGYLTLWGMTTRRGLWAGGIAGVAFADWTTTYEDASDALKAAISGWHKGTPEEKRELYIERSPITHAEQVDAPILVIQGRADSRTPRRQMEDFEAKMKALGKDIEVVWFDTGHFVMDPDLLIAFQQRRLDFAAGVLSAKGR